MKIITRNDEKGNELYLLNKIRVKVQCDEVFTLSTVEKKKQNSL